MGGRVTWWSTERELGRSAPSPLPGPWRGVGEGLWRARRRLQRVAAERWLGALGPPGRGARSAPLHLGLGYHGVCGAAGLEAGDYDPNLWVCEDFFRHQVHLIARLCAARRASEVWGAREEGAALAAAVTFDDGLSSVVGRGLPILREYGLPATLFVNDGVWGGGELWHDTAARAASVAPLEAAAALDLGAPLEALGFVAALKRLGSERLLEVMARLEVLAGPAPAGRYLEPAGVVAWRGAGHEVGGHGTRHLLLTRTRGALLRGELEGNRAALEALLGEPVMSYAYPNGANDRAARDAVAAAGYTSGWGIEHSDGGVLALSRRNISDAVCVDEEGRFSGALFLVWLLGRRGPR